MRGLRLGALIAATGVRIIPARAGFTAPAGPVAAARWDHPRSRGVYEVDVPVKSLLNGSSPLARGLPGDHITGWWEAGIIPARAGFTGRRSRRRGSRRDHPRSRGVYADRWLIRTVHDGSSPLARGLPQDRPLPRGPLGIIPARAGFTRISDSVATDLADHPRSRGVYLITAQVRGQVPGSSPLARGLHDGSMKAVWTNRIIPARAGFTTNQRSCDASTPDHPRSRGVYNAALALGHPTGGIIPARAGFTDPRGGSRGRCRGSSPLARGLHVKPLSAYPARGIIPARAGFTHDRRADQAPAPDHPRSRGVYSALEGHTVAPPGSSPLARGL